MVKLKLLSTRYFAQAHFKSLFPLFSAGQYPDRLPGGERRESHRADAGRVCPGEGFKARFLDTAKRNN